jgi:hypothetical protein
VTTIEGRPVKPGENRGRVKEDPRDSTKVVRTGKLWGKQIGEWSLIHAGLREPEPHWIAEVAALSASLGAEMPDWAKRASTARDVNGKPIGALVGAVVFTEGVRPEDVTDPREVPWVNPNAGYFWRVGKAVAFDRHIPCVGHQGFFTPDPVAHALAQSELKGLSP